MIGFYKILYYKSKPKFRFKFHDFDGKILFILDQKDEIYNNEQQAIQLITNKLDLTENEYQIIPLENHSIFDLEYFLNYKNKISIIFFGKDMSTLNQIKLNQFYIYKNLNVMNTIPLRLLAHPDNYAFKIEFWTALKAIF